MQMAKKHLGKGLRALIREPVHEEALAESTFSEIALDKIVRNPYQPREKMPADGIEALSRSIKEQGVLQPIVVQPSDEGYELVAGERRWTAARQAGLEKIPARIIQRRKPVELLEIALVENLQREDLNPLDIANGYHRLSVEFGLTHQDIADKVGTDRSTVTNMLRILNLPLEIRDCIRSGEISMGHARALLSLETVEEQLDALERIRQGGLSVRATEALGGEKRKKTKSAVSARDSNANSEFKAVEERLRMVFGTKIQIQKKKNEGVIQIHFYSDAEFERLLEMLEGGGEGQ